MLGTGQVGTVGNELSSKTVCERQARVTPHDRLALWSLQRLSFTYEELTSDISLCQTTANNLNCLEWA